MQALLSRSGGKNAQAAIRILTQDFHARSEKKTPYFLTEQFCELAKVRVDRVPLTECDARIMAIDGGFLAEVCSSHSPERQRFSLCHEIGHTFFASPKGKFYSQACGATRGVSSEEERLCDLAAAELLMPAGAFVEAAGSYSYSWQSIDQLSRIFFTSARATLTRCVELDVWPIVAITLDPVDPDRSFEGFRVTRVHSAKSAFAERGCQDVAVGLLRYALKEDASIRSSVLSSAKDRKITNATLDLEPLKRTMHLEFKPSLHGITALGHAQRYK